MLCRKKISRGGDDDDDDKNNKNNDDDDDGDISISINNYHNKYFAQWAEASTQWKCQGINNTTLGREDKEGKGSHDR